MRAARFCKRCRVLLEVADSSPHISISIFSSQHTPAKISGILIQWPKYLVVYHQVFLNAINWRKWVRKTGKRASRTIKGASFTAFTLKARHKEVNQFLEVILSSPTLAILSSVVKKRRFLIIYRTDLHFSSFSRILFPSRPPNTVFIRVSSVMIDTIQVAAITVVVPPGSFMPHSTVSNKIINNYSLKSRWIVAEYLSSREAAR